MRITGRRAVVCVAMLGTVLAIASGCTGGDGAPPASTDSTASEGLASSPVPIGTATSSALQSLEAVLPSTPAPLWREHPGAGPGTFENRDPTVPAGSYRLDVICAGGSLGVNVDGVRQRDVECTRQLEPIPVCVRGSAGLAVSAEWIRGPFDDLAWQLVPDGRGC